MRLNDQIAILLSDCASLLKLCPAGDPQSAANIFAGCAQRIAGVASWLSGQAALLRAPDCDLCHGSGWLAEDTRCGECAGTGKCPVGKEES